MRRFAAILLTASLMVTVMSGLSPTLGEAPPNVDFGRYSQFWGEHDLTEAHVADVPGGLEIKGPSFTSALRVNSAFLDQELGAWSADRAFTNGDGTADFEGRKAVFQTLELTEEAVFTWGHPSQIQLLERPMWLSAHQEEYGESVTISFDDGNTDGQTIFVSKEWLWERGIHRPNATHEDGTQLLVTPTEDGQGFLIDVHHFSWVELSAADISVLGKLGNGLVLPHTGRVLWDNETFALDIAVSNYALTYTVYVERDWIEMNIPPWRHYSHSWTLSSLNGQEYFAIPLTAPETPGQLVFAYDPGQCIMDPAHEDDCPLIIPIFDVPTVIQPVIITLVQLASHHFFDGGAGDACPGTASGQVFWLGEHPRGPLTSDNPDITGEREVLLRACYGLGANDRATVFWHVKIVAQNGRQLYAGSSNASPCWTGYRAACIQVLNASQPVDEELISWFEDGKATDAGVSACAPWGGSLGVNILGTGGSIGLSGQSCWMNVQTQANGMQEGRWAVRKTSGDGSDTTFNEFHFGMAQRVPVAYGQLDAELKTKYLFRFKGDPQCYWWGTCVIPVWATSFDWTKSFTKTVVDSDEALQVALGVDEMPLGSMTYDYPGLTQILDVWEQDNATKLATYAMGARLRNPLGELTNQALADALSAADDLLSSYSGALPWAPGTIAPVVASQMELARIQLEPFVNPVVPTNE